MNERCHRCGAVLTPVQKKVDGKMLIFYEYHHCKPECPIRKSKEMINRAFPKLVKKLR